jgi:cation:H+ antiporter
MNYLLLLVGLVLLAVCAEMLTRGSTALAARFRVPEFIVGLTVVAVGTSMPELTVSVLSAAEGNGAMSIGNVTGSNLFNTLVILGVCALIRPLVFTRENIRRDIPICIGASLALAAVIFGDRTVREAGGSIGRAEGVAMLAAYVAVIIWSIRSARRDGPTAEARDDAAPSDKNPMPITVICLFIAAGLGGLIGGGELCLKSAEAIARSWGVSESIIAITIVAAGTSLPELASSISAVAKGKFSMAVGNIIGSNIFNILFILGASSTVHPLTASAITPLDIWMVVGSAVLLLVSASVIGVRRITRAEGAAYLAIYVGYVIMLIK